MSLARGFMYAGVPSVVMSLWPVDDKSTAELTNYFYDGLNNGLAKDEALRQAKLRFLEGADEVKANPFYWAGMVSTGNPAPISPNLKNQLLIWSTAILIVLFVLGFVLKSKMILQGKKPDVSKSFLTIFLAFIFFSSLAFKSLLGSLESDVHLYAQSSYGIAKSDTAAARGFLARAKGLRDQVRYDSSDYYLLKAAAIYETEKLWENYVNCYNRLADNAWRVDDYERALKLLDIALKVAKKDLDENNIEIAQNYDIRGTVLEIMGNYEQALECYQRALALEIKLNSEYDVARTYNSMAIIFGIIGDYDKALEYLLRAFEIAKNRPKSQMLLASICGNLGFVYELEKDYDKALGFHEQALSIHLKILNQDHPEIALDYHNLGYIYYDKGDYANAREAYERAISINRKSYGEQHMSLAQNYTELSKVYLEQSNYESALEYAQKAQLISLKIFGNRHVDVATNYHEISRIYHRKKNYRKALEFQNESLSIRNELFGEKHPHVAASYQELGDIKSNENDHHAALAYYQQSIISLVQSFNDSDIYANPKLENISDRQALLKSLELKAETFYHLYSAQLNNLKDLEASFAACRLADELIAKMRMEYSTEGSKLALGAQAAKIYNKAIRTALKLYEISKDEKYKEAAFKFAEKNKAGVLYDALSSVRAKQFAGIPDSLLEYEKKLKIDLGFYEKSLFEERQNGEDADSAKLALWQDKLFRLQRNSDSLLNKFEKEFPDYYKLRFNVATVLLKNCKKMLWVTARRLSNTPWATTRFTFSSLRTMISASLKLQEIHPSQDRSSCCTRGSPNKIFHYTQNMPMRSTRL